MYKKESVKPLIIQAMAMNLTQKDMLTYLASRGFKISRQYLTRLQKHIRESRFDRLALIAKHEFVDQHLERIDTLNLIQQEMWKLYNSDKPDLKKLLVLEKLAELQSYISPYYDASRYVMEQSIKKDNKDNDNNETKENQSVSVI